MLTLQEPPDGFHMLVPILSHSTLKYSSYHPKNLALPIISWYCCSMDCIVARDYE